MNKNRQEQEQRTCDLEVGHVRVCTSVLDCTYTVVCVHERVDALAHVGAHWLECTRVYSYMLDRTHAEQKQKKKGKKIQIQCPAAVR